MYENSRRRSKFQQVRQISSLVTCFCSPVKSAFLIQFVVRCENAPLFDNVLKSPCQEFFSELILKRIYSKGRRNRSLKCSLINYSKSWKNFLKVLFLFPNSLLFFEQFSQIRLVEISSKMGIIFSWEKNLILYEYF